MNRFFKSKSFRVFFCFCFLAILINFIVHIAYSYAQNQDDVLYDPINIEDQVLFLSDITYKKAQVGWGNISFDKTQSNTPLTLILDGTATEFKKGIWAHATSTIEYDISAYKDYAYFTTYYGLNTSAGSTGNGVKFYIYTSKDGKEWNLETPENPVAMKGVNNAAYAKIDIRDVNYIRLYANDNGSNASDHAVWADTKLVKEEYIENVMVPVEDFDLIIKSKYTNGAIQDDLILTLLQRTFIRRVGQYQLRSFISADSKNRETIEWFLHNEEALRLWIMGGIPNGSYQNALKVLSNLYHAHKEDLENENVTSNGTKFKDLYLRMMLSLSLTHSSSIGLWIGGNQLSDAVVRYEIFKDLHLNNKLFSSGMFERLTVEEMRWLMHVNIDDEEINWLRDFSEKKYGNIVDRFNPFKYIKYTTGYSYYRPQYYSSANYAKWDQKYELSKYNITYQSGKPKLWIVFEEGSVCGGLSKTAANLYGVWGVPSSVVGQPAHAAYIYYYEVGGNGAWQLAYNVTSTGWANTQGYSRMPNDWGNFSSGIVSNSATIKSASYFFLSQQAQNEYDKYEKSELILLLEDVYKDDKSKLEQIYRDALKEEIINWDAWFGLVKLYLTDDSKSESDVISLAEEISEVYAYQPLPMYDFTRKLGAKIVSPQYRSKLMLLQNQTLRKATQATASNTLQYKEVPVVAQALLGEIHSELATFSFTGANAGKIILSKQLQSTQVTWSYSLDGGKTWKDCYEYFAQLTEEELASINVTNDIKIHISGLDYSNKNIYTIDITKRTFPNGVVTINDEEDRMFGVTSEMEWSLDPSKGWNSFANTNPLFSGNVKVYVRVIASGTQIASDPVYFTFKENNSDDTKWYIQSQNLSVVEVNATQSGNKDNIIDGNLNTYWRSKENVMPAYVTIKLNEPRYISGLDYAPDKSAKYLTFIPYGRARNVNVYVSMDGSNWELAVSKNNLGDNENLKHIEFPEPKKAMYVKFECTQPYDGPNASLTVSVIKLYENVLVNETPRAEINYSIVNPTNQNVVAELVNLIRPITVTNNGGKTSYTFTKNGEFTFEFVDENGNKGSATARVDWIDKTAPTVQVTYSNTNPTNEEVVATLVFDKEVTILSKDVQVAENPDDQSKTITFLENASYVLEFADKLGNIGSKTIGVDWIDKEAPTAEFAYNTVHLTDQDVVATLKPSEPVTILNNNGSDTYTFTDNGEFTFEFVDQAGNHGSATAYVTWISPLPKYEVVYSTTQPTNQDVEVTLKLEDGYHINNNDGEDVYIFTENGNFDFQYIDGKGNVGVIPVVVNWIDKVAPTAELNYVKEKNRVIVSVVRASEEIRFREGNGTYEFTENGTYEIIFYDMVGNEGKLVAVIDSIRDEDPGEDNKPGVDEPSKPTPPGEDNEPGVDEPSKPTPPGEDNKPGVDEPSKPNPPTDDNKPGVDEPSRPNPPTEDNKPGVNQPSKPNQSGNHNSSRPNQNNPGNFSIENNPEINLPNDSETEVPSEDIETDPEKNQYTSQNIRVELPEDVLIENALLTVTGFSVTDELKKKFGDASEYFDISLVTSEKEEISLDPEKVMKITIKLNGSKEFLGVYEITDNQIVRQVKYTKNGDSIEIKTNHLGKVVVSYQEVKPVVPAETVPPVINTKHHGINWLVIGCMVFVLGIAIYFSSKLILNKGILKF